MEVERINKLTPAEIAAMSDSELLALEVPVNSPNYHRLHDAMIDARNRQKSTGKEAGGTWLQDRLYAAGNDTSLPVRIRALLKGAAYRIKSDAKEAG